MNFKEYMIKKEKTARDILLMVLCYVGAFILSFVFMMFLPAIHMGSFALLFSVGAFYLAYFLSTRLNKEYEYIVTDDNIDIDVIMNRSRRKRLISFTLNQVEVLASTKDDRYNAEAKGQFDKTIDATSGKKDANVYFAVVDKNGKNLVLFEPTYTMVENLNRFARSKVHVFE